MTKYERELQTLRVELKYIPNRLKEIKRRGRYIAKCQMDIRKASIQFETERRICLSLPKPWQQYRAHGVGLNLYSRPEVTAIHEASRQLYAHKDRLQYAIERYNARHTDRAELKKRLKLLPGEIECLEQLVKIQAEKRAKKKPKREKEWHEQWEEIDDGLVVCSKVLNNYLKTFNQPIESTGVNIDTTHNLVTVFPDIKNKNIYLRLPCVTWEQAKRVSLNG